MIRRLRNLRFENISGLYSPLEVEQCLKRKLTGDIRGIPIIIKTSPKEEERETRVNKVVSTLSLLRRRLLPARSWTRTRLMMLVLSRAADSVVTGASSVHGPASSAPSCSAFFVLQSIRCRVIDDPISCFLLNSHLGDPSCTDRSALCKTLLLSCHPTHRRNCIGTTYKTFNL